MRAQVEEAQRKYDELTMENEMLADYLLRDESVFQQVNAEEAKPGKKSAKQKAQTLTLEEKFKIANGEVETLNKDIESTKKATETNLDVLKALMEETDIRIAEVKRDAYEFRRDIVVGAENGRTGKTMAEKVLKYLEDKLTAKDMLINKLLMKNQAFKGAIKKQEAQLRSKMEGGDDLQYIDFHQLQIENQEFVVKIEEANHELIQLKRTSGRTVKMLNNMKKKLNYLTSEAADVRDEIGGKKRVLDTTEQDLANSINERERERRESRKYRNGSKLEVQTLDYVNQKQEEGELQRQKAQIDKKLEITSTAYKKARQTAARNGIVL